MKPEVRASTVSHECKLAGEQGFLNKKYAHKSHHSRQQCIRVLAGLRVMRFVMSSNAHPIQGQTIGKGCCEPIKHDSFDLQTPLVTCYSTFALAMQFLWRLLALVAIANRKLIHLLGFEGVGLGLHSFSAKRDVDLYRLSIRAE
jgi:hypothetical protein